MSVYPLATMLHWCAMFPVGRSGVEVSVNDAEQALIGGIRAMWVDGMSFARIAGQFDAVKALTTTTPGGQHDGEKILDSAP
jgi:hypothetical protein